jgi:hypothetical protein
MLSAFIVTHGGEVRRDRVAAIELKGKVVTALRTEHKSDEIVPVAVVDATSARDLVDRLPSGRAREKLLTQQGRVVVSGGATAVRWLVPVRALPRGIPPSLLILDDAGALPILASICMGAPLSDTGKGAHLDDTHVCVVAVGATRESGAVEEALVRLMPFCRGAAKANDVVDASAVAGHFEIKDSEHVLGGRRPRTVLKNLVRAGRDLAPAWGTDGELVAARAVHSLVQKQFPKVPKPTE